MTPTDESEIYPFTSSSDVSFDKPRIPEELAVTPKIEQLEEKMNSCQAMNYVSNFSLSLSKSTSATSSSSFTSSAVSMSKSKLNTFLYNLFLLNRISFIKAKGTQNNRGNNH